MALTRDHTRWRPGRSFGLGVFGGFVDQHSRFGQYGQDHDFHDEWATALFTEARMRRALSKVLHSDYGGEFGFDPKSGSASTPVPETCSVASSGDCQPVAYRVRVRIAPNSWRHREPT